VGASGTSGLSSEVSATPRISPPAAPVGLTATKGNRTVALKWTATSGATSYNIYRGTAAGAEHTTPIATGIKTPSFTNIGLTDGKTYFFKVAAVNAGGRSPLSNEVSATPGQ
jgi:fibronectin type 3 domain-containing protein